MNMKGLIIVGVLAFIAFQFWPKTPSGTSNAPAQPQAAVETTTTPEQPEDIGTITSAVQKELDDLQTIMAKSIGEDKKTTISSLDALYKVAQGNAIAATMLDVDQDQEDKRVTLASSATHTAMAIFEYKDSLMGNNAQVDAARKDLEQARNDLKKVKE